MRTHFLSLLALAPFYLASAPVQGDRVEPIRVLYITGGGYHDYKGQEAILREMLSARTPIEWTADFEAGGNNNHRLTRFQEAGWHEGFDAVIYNMCFAAVRDSEYIERITSAHHQSGVAALVLHCAMHTFRDAETSQWDRLVGVRTYHHEQQKREFQIEPVNMDHPVMRGFPEEGWLSPSDELYIIQETFEHTIPLTRTFGPETDRRHTVMWVNEYGKARVVGTTAGHNNEVMADPVYLDFLARGLLWSVHKLDDEGKPLPGYQVGDSTAEFIPLDRG